MTDIVQKAYEFAEKAHKGVLDDDGVDFFTAHPCQVAEILNSVTDDENVIAAAYLHDVVEDTPITQEELRKEFGDDITDLVMEVTHEGRKDAGGYYFPRLHSQEGVMIKFADRLSNLSRLEAWPAERKAHYIEKSSRAFPKTPRRKLEDFVNKPLTKETK